MLARRLISGSLLPEQRIRKPVWFSSRPVSESESEGQRARNGANESERDFSRERATIHTSESKRAKFRMGRDFSFYSALQWSIYVCSIYRAYGSPVSVRFPLFQHQHSTNVGCFWASRCLCKLSKLTAFQTGPVRDSNNLHTRVISHKTSKNRLRFGLYPSPRRGSLWRSPRPPIVGGLGIG